MALRTVCVAHPRLAAIRAGVRPSALCKRICARRRVKASGERRPAWIACRSESSRGRTKVGGFIQPIMRRTRPLHKITLETALAPRLIENDELFWQRTYHGPDVHDSCH